MLAIFYIKCRIDIFNNCSCPAVCFAQWPHIVLAANNAKTVALHSQGLGPNRVKGFKGNRNKLISAVCALLLV